MCVWGGGGGKAEQFSKQFVARFTQYKETWVIVAVKLEESDNFQAGV